MIGDDEPDAPDYKKLMGDGYWPAAPMYDERVASGIIEAMDDRFATATDGGIYETMSRAWRMYSSLGEDGYGGNSGFPITTPQFVGENGEFTYLDINHFRNGVRHKIAQITSERPAFEPNATGGDAIAMEQVSVARNVIDYAMDQRGVAQGLIDACEVGSVQGSAFTHLRWDPNAGKSGDLVVDILMPVEVTHQECRNYKDADWFIVRSFESRWTLAAEAHRSGDPELAVEIAEADFGPGDYQFSPFAAEDGDSERIPVYHFYHRKTPAMPNGRHTRVTGGGVVIQDGALGFAEIPVYRYAPSEFIGTSVPYANSWDAMPLHTMENAVVSAWVSRVDAFGTPNVAVEEGTEIGADDFQGFSITNIRPGGAVPSVIELLHPNPMLAQTVQMLEDQTEKITGINSVTRGNPKENITSGSMAALVEAQFAKFSSPEELGWAMHSEQVLGGVIKMYQVYATEEMIITVSGDPKRTVREFKGDGLDRISRVSVKRTNALTKTNSFKLDAAKELFAQGTGIKPHEFMALVETGVYSPMFQDEVAMAAYIADENSRMLNGEQVEPGEIERHDLHIPEHAAELDSRMPQSNPEAAQALKKHIMEHMLHWQNQSLKTPMVCVAMGMPILPGGPAAQQAQGGGEQPPAGAEKKAGPAGSPAKPPGDNPGADKQPRMPSAPTNPATGEKADI